jgi:hypothetical protein
MSFISVDQDHQIVSELRWTPIARQPKPSLRWSPTDFGIGSDRAWRDGHDIASSIVLVNSFLVLVVVPVGMWAKAQPVGEADRPHIHGHSAS